MKIELKYDGKNYHDPNFKLFWNHEKNKFAIGICHHEHKSYEFIIKDIDENFEKYQNKEQTLLYYTKDNVYSFNLNKNFELFPFNTVFEHCVVLLDKDDKIIESNYRSFEAILDGNFNK